MIEANPRASRTVPFVSKAIGVPLAKIACRLMLGERLARHGARRSRRAAAARVGEGGGASVRALPARRRAARPRDEVDGRGDGHRGRLPGRVRQGAGRGRRGAAARRAPCSSRSRTATSRPRPSSPRGFHDLGFRVARHRRHRAGDPPHGRAGRAAQQDLRGLAERGRPDRVRRGRPRDQHPHGLGRARGRLRDPARRDRRAASRASRRCRAPARPSGRSASSRSGETVGDLASGAARRRLRARRRRRSAPT